MVGVIGGIMMIGLLAGALFNNIWILLLFVGAGFIAAGSWSFLKRNGCDNRKLKEYPTYRY